MATKKITLNELRRLVKQVINEEKKIPKKGTPDYHQHKIAVDTIKNPMKGKFLGGPSEEEAKEILMDKFGYTLEDINKLTK